MPRNPVTRHPATRTQDAADALMAWLDGHADPRSSAPTQAPVEQQTDHLGTATAAPGCGLSRARAVTSPSDGPRPAVAPAHPDWLFHHLRIEGPADAIAGFRGAAAGAGIVPWHLDLHRVEEDAFLRLAAPTGQARTLSLEGARMLAAELRDAVARRHALAVARVGNDTSCCFDLHALVPVPGDVLRLGPDHPDALRWLWAHWGTTEALRHVALAPDRDETVPAERVLRVTFWSADWTPWRALATVRARFSSLCFDVQPLYDRA